MDQHDQTPSDLDLTPHEQSEEKEDAPRFGRLLLVLIAVVGLIVFITLASEAYYS